MKFILSAIIFAVCCPSSLVCSQTATPDREVLVGRVIADVPRLTHGAGIGPLWQDFIFGVQSENEPTKIKPVLIAYAFHNYKLDGPLPDAFFNHSKLYELHVRREAHCDDTVESLSIVKNEIVDGRPLPPSPGIAMLDGAPKDILKPDMVLPCYVLYRGNYRVK